eukprot:ANDGO_02747.mRNA.1 hypothetical protein
MMSAELYDLLRPPVPQVLFRVISGFKASIQSRDAEGSQWVSVTRVPSSCRAELEQLAFTTAFCNHIRTSDSLWNEENKVLMSFTLFKELVRLRYFNDPSDESCSSPCSAASVPAIPVSCEVVNSYAKLIKVKFASVLHPDDEPQGAKLRQQFNAICHQLYRPRLDETVAEFKGAFLRITLIGVPMISSFSSLSYSADQIPLERVYSAAGWNDRREFQFDVPLQNPNKIYFLADAAILSPDKFKTAVSIELIVGRRVRRLNETGGMALADASSILVDVQQSRSESPMWNMFRIPESRQLNTTNDSFQVLSVEHSIKQSAYFTAASAEVDPFSCQFGHAFHVLRLVPRLESWPMRTPIESGLLVVFRTIVVPPLTAATLFRDLTKSIDLPAEVDPLSVLRPRRNSAESESKHPPSSSQSSPRGLGSGILAEFVPQSARNPSNESSDSSTATYQPRPLNRDPTPPLLRPFPGIPRTLSDENLSPTPSPNASPVPATETVPSWATRLFSILMRQKYAGTLKTRHPYLNAEVLARANIWDLMGGNVHESVAFVESVLGLSVCKQPSFVSPSDFRFELADNTPNGSIVKITPVRPGITKTSIATFSCLWGLTNSAWETPSDEMMYVGRSWSVPELQSALSAAHANLL